MRFLTCSVLSCPWNSSGDMVMNFALSCCTSAAWGSQPNLHFCSVEQCFPLTTVMDVSTFFTIFDLGHYSNVGWLLLRHWKLTNDFALHNFPTKLQYQECIRVFSWKHLVCCSVLWLWCNDFFSPLKGRFVLCMKFESILPPPLFILIFWTAFLLLWNIINSNGVWSIIQTALSVETWMVVQLTSISGLYLA